MKTHLTAALLATIVLLLLACHREESDFKDTVEKYLTARYLVPVETGVIVADAQRANALEAADADGLISLRKFPQSHSDSFLAQTQGIGTPYEVTPKQKLLDAAEPRHKWRKRGEQPRRYSPSRVGYSDRDPLGKGLYR